MLIYLHSVNIFTPIGSIIDMGGKKVKIEMIKREITQTELAKRLGLSLPHLNLIINGHRKTRWIREAIARELNVRVEDLFEESRSH